LQTDPAMNRQDLLRARAPRYTSYPPIPHWEHDPDPRVIAAALGRAGAPAEVYLHLPFCLSQCSYCGCNMVVARTRAIGDRYRHALTRQLAELPLPAVRHPIQRLHLGGGTPTWFTPDELSRLMAMLRGRLAPTAGAELSVEAAPHATTGAHVLALARAGFTRLSLGVQSFERDVLRAVGRPEAVTQVARLVSVARGCGFRGLNLDLMRGLPHQTHPGFRRTLERAVALEPDRLAVFGYAHVPHLKPHQAHLDESTLPDGPTRQAMAALAREVLGGAGYVAIGLDHFARPDDPLARAGRSGSLHRNFMGYSPRACGDMIGLGTSAISKVGGVFWQDEPHLGRWLRKVEQGAPLATRAWVLSAEDQLRLDVIETLLCNGRVDLGLVADRHGNSLAAFDRERAALAPFVDSGLALDEDGVVSVPADLPEALRPVAALFDAYSGSGPTGTLAV